jgi:maleate isomerase
MVDTLGWRMKFAIVTPSVNTVVQPEYEALRPAGVTNHIFRMNTPNPQMSNDAEFATVINQVDAGLEEGVKQATTCDPGHLVLGVSIESVWGGGLAASKRVGERIGRLLGPNIGISQAAQAIPDALKAFKVKRKISILTPYYPVAEPHIVQFIRDIGFDIVKMKHLSVTKPTEFAWVTESTLRDALYEIDAPDVEAVVQFGANLPMMRVAAEAERWLGKPVIAVNPATYWHALRSCGINDKIHNHGRLLEEF